jgi:hypothetical protein
LNSLYEDIIERRCGNGARIGYEYQYETRAGLQLRNSRAVTGSSQPPWYTPEKQAAFLAWFNPIIKECMERLAREKVLVYKLNEQRTELSGVGYLTKEETEALAWVLGGEMLDLDHVYGGILFRNDYLIISENKFEQGLRRYGSDIEPGDLIEHLIRE